MTTKDIAIDKDNREALSFNLQFTFLYDNEFITYTNFCGEKVARLKLMACEQEVNKLDEKQHLDSLGNLSYTISQASNNVVITITNPNNITVARIKSIVFYDGDDNSKVYYIAKNVAALPNADKLQPWYIYPVFND